MQQVVAAICEDHGLLFRAPALAPLEKLRPAVEASHRFQCSSVGRAAAVVGGTRSAFRASELK